MSLCNITGTIKDAGAVLAGELWVQADGTIIDTDTTPDTTILPRLYKFTITAGVININLHESETSQTTYHFEFWPDNPDTDTGLDNDPAIDFHAVVPNLASVEFSNLVPTGITRDALDTSIQRLARLLTTVEDYVQALRGGPDFKGEYADATFYRLGDAVGYGGSTWIYIAEDPSAGNVPAIASPFWQLAAQKGDPGGTGGQDTAYSAAGWDGQTWAPTANAIRDKFELMAPLASPALTGNPTAPTQTTGNSTTRLATTAFVVAEIISRLTNTALTGNPTAPTQTVTDNSTRLATTEFTKLAIGRSSRVADIKASGTDGGASIAGVQTRTLNTIVENAGDILSLSSNQITLRAGTYLVNANAPSRGTDRHRIYLWNVTANALVPNCLGSCELARSTAGAASSSFLFGRFAIAANTVLELRHYTQVANAVEGLGPPTSQAGFSEIFAQIEFIRID